MERMVFEAFIREIRQDLIEELDEKTTLTVEILKGDEDRSWTHLLIQTPEVPAPITVDLDNTYKAYCKGQSIDSICDMIIMFVEDIELDVQEQRTEDLKYLGYRVKARLINAEYNSELIEGLPHQKMLDLAVVYVMIQLEDEANGVEVPIDYKMMEGLKFNDENELGQYAQEEMKTFDPPIFRSMREMLEEAMGIPFPQDGPERLYVLSTKSRMYGAYWIAVPDVRRKIAQEVGGDYYVLPSSIHDCLIAPMTVEQSPKELRAIVEEVNRTQVEPEAVLSDHIYKYISERDELIIFA